MAMLATEEHTIQEVKAVVRAHEAAVRAGDLDAVMRNFADDVVTLVSGLPLVEGRDSARALYTQMLAAGAWDATHHYAGAAVTADSVVVHGVALGTFTPSGGEAGPIATR